MVEDYLVRPYKQGDEKEVVELLDIVFNGWPHYDLKYPPLEHWKWKYLYNPFKVTQLFLCERNNKIVGCSFSVIVRLKIGDEVYLSGYGTDNAVYPEFRRMGISKKLYDIKFQHGKDNKFVLLYWITGNEVLIKYSLKNYPYFPFLLINYVRIKSFNKHLRINNYSYKRSFLLWIGFHTVKLFNIIKNIFKRSMNKGDIQINQITYFDDRFNKFWDEIKDHYSFIVERNKGYLNWRYQDQRGGDYIIKTAEEAGYLIGYMVLRINKYQINYPKGYVVDLITHPDRPDVVDTLLSNAISYFNSKNINIIHYLCPKNHSYENILKRNGFLDSRDKNLVFYYLLDNKEIESTIKKIASYNAYFCYGDSDAI